MRLLLRRSFCLSLLGFCLIATDLLYLQEKSGGLLQFARRQTDWSSLSSSRVAEIFGDKLGASRFIDFCRLLRADQRYQLHGVVAGYGWHCDCNRHATATLATLSAGTICRFGLIECLGHGTLISSTCRPIEVTVWAHPPKCRTTASAKPEQLTGSTRGSIRRARS